MAIIPNVPAVYEELDWQERKEVREQYVRLQDNKCYHCKSDLRRDPPKSITDKKINWRLFPTGFRDYPVHLHHSHKTGLTIGAVHNYCNAVLWQYHGE